MTAIKERLNKMETLFNDQSVIVLDFGTGFVKAGWCGEDLPRCVIPTIVGTREIVIDPS